MRLIIAYLIMMAFSFGTIVFAEEDPVYVTYGNQKIDITQFVDIGEPFIRATTNSDDNSLYMISYTRRGPKIVRMPFENGSWNEDAAEEVFDYGKRSMWKFKYHPTEKNFYVVSDEFNDEAFNTYSFNFGDGQLRKVTSHGYQPDYGFSANGDSILSVGRIEKMGQEACLKETSLTQPDQQREIFCNKGEIVIYPWQYATEDSVSGKIAFTVTSNGNRSTLNIVLVDRDKDEPKFITDKSKKRSTLSILGWHDGSLYYIANQGEELPQLYKYHLDSDNTEVVIANKDHPSVSGYFSELHRKIYLFIRKNAENSKLSIINLNDRSHRTLSINELDLIMPFASDLSDGLIAVAGTNLKDPTTPNIFIIDDSAQLESNVVRVGYAKRTERHATAPCKAEEIHYETFDKDPATGNNRLINAIMFRPAEPSAGEKAALVYAHGGPSAQMTKTTVAPIDFLCKLGYVVLAPNPRGSTGFGQDFEDMNNYDWGGGDFFDYEFARKYLVEKEGIEESRIGITGGSFGGYMTNWAMTRPGNHFAFGISDYGIADVLFQIRHSVVGDNMTSDMGDPIRNEALYTDRSPINYISHLNKPLLITHGSRDFRCYYEDSRRFAKACKEAGKDVTYFELDGDGHGYRYPDTLPGYYQQLATFLYKHAPID